MTCDNAAYRYEPLDSTRQQIRLLSILPEPSGTIKCHLKNAYLDDVTRPEYRAVSYVWGPPTPMKHIIVNGRSLEIRENLHTFFEAFRARLFKFKSNGEYQDEMQWLWVDQVCINQTVIGERNHQVKMMSSIYQNAIYVYVWLGPSDENIEAAMRDLKTGLRNYYEERINRKVSGNRKPRKVDETSKKCTPAREVCKSSASRVHALRCFFENSYWKRLWVVQEVMLSRYIRIICGETLLSWEELRRFCLTGMQQSPLEVQGSLSCQMIWMVEHALLAKTYTYTDLVTTFSTSKCQDPRDKVYGLQGLLAPEDRVRIDYAQSIERCFYDAVCLMWKDLNCTTTIQTTNRLEQIDFTKPAMSVFLEASSILSAEANALMNTPFITALVNLGTEMGLDTRRLHAAWISRRDFNEIQDQWVGIVEYYVEDRLPALYSGTSETDSLENRLLRENYKDDILFLLHSTPVLDAITELLAYRYSRLLFLLRRFMLDITMPQGYWQNVKRDIYVLWWRYYKYRPFPKSALQYRFMKKDTLVGEDEDPFLPEIDRRRASHPSHQQGDDPFNMGTDDPFSSKSKDSSFSEYQLNLVRVLESIALKKMMVDGGASQPR